MIEMEEELFEFEFDDTINLPKESAKLAGISFDVCPGGNPMVGSEKACIVVMSNEKPELNAQGEIVLDEEGKELWAHEPFGYFEFQDPECFDLAVTALKLFEIAITMEINSRDLEKTE